MYLCSIDGADGTRGWLGVRDDGSIVTSRAEVRAAVSIAALCEVAVDTAGGGDLDGLIASLAELREREAPEGIEDAEAAARALRDVLGEPPQLATPARLDEIGVATRRLERELDPGGASPFAAALKGGAGRRLRAPARGRGRLPGRPHVTCWAMEGSGGFFPFGGGDPEDLLGALREFAERRPSRCRRRSASSSRRSR